MKHISEIATGFSLIMLVLTGLIAFNVQNAVAEHDSNKDNHPHILSQIQATNARLELATLKLEQVNTISKIVQNQNQEDHKRMFAELEKISRAIDQL